MRRYYLALAVALSLGLSHASAQVFPQFRPSQPGQPSMLPPGCPTPFMPSPTNPTSPTAPTDPANPTAPTDPGAASPADPSNANQPGANDAFAQAPAAGTGGEASSNPTMFGDFSGPLVRQHHTGALIPLAARGYKIADNESPRPLDRVFVTYNYFSNLGTGPLGTGASRPDLHRETVGFEKTFLDGNASIGMRLPVNQFSGTGGTSLDGLGDLTVILKYALLNDRVTGNVISGGLAVTVPTGRDVWFPTDAHPVVLQPYAGFLWNQPDWYVHGFSSVVIPTDNDDATMWFNDLGVGYWLLRADPGEDRFLTGIVPTLEGHVTTPLSNRGLSRADGLGVPDIFSITGGVNWIFHHRCQLGTAVNIPLTGPNPYDFEVLANFNMRF